VSHFVTELGTAQYCPAFILAQIQRDKITVTYQLGHFGHEWKRPNHDNSEKLKEVLTANLNLVPSSLVVTELNPPDASGFLKDHSYSRTKPKQPKQGGVNKIGPEEDHSYNCHLKKVRYFTVHIGMVTYCVGRYAFADSLANTI